MTRERGIEMFVQKGRTPLENYVFFFERKISTTTMTSLGTRESNVFNSRSRYFTITSIIVFFRDYFLVVGYRISNDCYLLNISNYVDLFWIITVPSKTTCKKCLSNAEVLENTHHHRR